MADEVPVCDVLCEAMEYLSKLGSNLRARSENLKEKRIRKDKLKNYHAVQKAADKVLLICQLSKKSLENVECGVRKVLTLMSASQELGKEEEMPSPSSTGTAQGVEYRHFKYRSYKLKISKKVPVKHYMSVRVLARNMPLSLHDKYPVYHNCKLYRSRKRKVREKRTELETIDCANNKIYDESEDHDDLILHTVAKDVIKVLESSKSSNYNNSYANKLCENANESDGVSEHEEKTSRKLCSERNSLDGHDDDVKAETGKKLKKKTNRLSQSSSRSIHNSDDEHTKHRNSTDSKLKKVQVLDDDSSDNNNDEKDGISETEKSLDNSRKCGESNKFLDHCDSFSEIIKPKKPETNISVDQEEINNGEASETPKENENPDHEAKQEILKPLIKCVNISKLLKPDVAENSKESPLKKSLTKKSINTDSDCSINKENIICRKSTKRKQSSDSDEDFWEQKRIEVNAFVSKNFLIKVSRLPEMSEVFLNLHNLKKIIQNNSIIFEIGNEEGNKEMSNEVTLANANSSNAPPDQINVVKSALLNDSDSEKSDFSGSKSPLPLAEIQKTVNNLLNNDTNICRNITRSPFTELEETVKKVLSESFDGNNEIDDSKTENEVNICSDGTDPVKNALLNDSDSDNERNVQKGKEEESQSNNMCNSKGADFKQTLLAESDSENLDHNKSVLASKGEDNNLCKDANENNAEDMSRTHEEKTENITQIESSPNKDPLANKMDDDTEISPKKKKKHKRKNIMESMHAKKMLLTYSSSSDTEDEQLRNALREIKDSLLKGVSSSDDEKKNKEVEKASSSEEENILKRLKKKRKSLNQSVHSESQSVASNKSSDNEKRNETDQSSRSSTKSGVKSKCSSKKVRFE